MFWTIIFSGSVQCLKVYVSRDVFMAKLYFLGGENIAKRDSKVINEAAFNDAGEAPSVMVFSWARTLFDQKRGKKLVEYFKSLGAGSVEFAEYNANFGVFAEKIEKSDLIYLPGGLASVLVERLKSKSIDRLLHSYGGIVVGRSAGALALGKKCVVTKHGSRVKSVLIDGIGLVNFSMKAHYTPSKDYWLKRFSVKEKIYAIAERSALVYSDGVMSFIGDVFLFQNGKKKRAG